ncbi:MAG: mechanosensitive ion channel [Opitutales bacterium]|nr:mechanosensitive ion channel [Opitutales bacterium]
MRKWFFDALPSGGALGMDRDTLAVAAAVAAAGLITLAATHLLKKTLTAAFSKIKLKKFERQSEIIKNRKVFSKASAVVAPICMLLFVPAIFPKEDIGDELFHGTTKFLLIYLYAALWSFIMAALGAANDLFSIGTRKSVHGFVQTLQLLASLVMLILAVSTIMDKSPLNILAGLGASAAVLMIVFRDSLLGLAASVQLSANNMLQIGDWIAMEKYDADGKVEEIGLTVVKVRNWDNTITNLPTYALVSDAYKNWRGMEESGGRRVKRHILIDQQSVAFRGGSTETNVGAFRKYLENFLAENPKVIADMPRFVRLLQPTESGLPLELYFFATTDWIPYEHVQSEILEHAIASARNFGLRIYQDESDAPAESPAPTPQRPASIKQKKERQNAAL